MARATYYYHFKQAERLDKFGEIKRRIRTIYEENKGRIGHRRITIILHAEQFKINQKTVLKKMRQLGLFCKVRMSKYHSYQGEVGKIAPDLLGREFEASRPNQKWVTDVTEFKVLGQKIYLSPILDLYNGEVISYSISSSPSFRATIEMLNKAFRRLPEKVSLILHSDQGWQYQMRAYQRLLKERGIRQSMSRKGNCYDNAVIENFFGLLKSEFFHNKSFDSVDAFKQELEEYIEYYNVDRIKVKLRGLSPVAYRTQSNFFT